MSASSPGEACHATVIIPTFNGGRLLAEVVGAVLAQQAPWPFELLVIDSSSSDGSLRCLEGTPARLVTLPRDAFNHGRTRNDAAKQASGSYLVFLVQDATPVGPRWLAALVAALEAHPEAVGGYARQIARPDADPALRRRIDAWTPPGDRPELRRVAPEVYRRLEPAARIRLAAFDNVCSVVRREHLLSRPFPEVPFGEDLCWGEAQLLAGHALLYVPTAAVIHSHRRGFLEDVRRSRIEHRLLIERFGLRAVPGLDALVRQSAEVLASSLATGPEGVRRQLAELVGRYLASRGAGCGPF